LYCVWVVSRKNTRLLGKVIDYAIDLRDQLGCADLYLSSDYQVCDKPSGYDIAGHDDRRLARYDPSESAISSSAFLAFDLITGIDGEVPFVHSKQQLLRLAKLNKVVINVGGEAVSNCTRAMAIYTATKHILEGSQ